MRKILFTIGNRAHYARLKPIIEKLNELCEYKILVYDTAYSVMKDKLKCDIFSNNCVFINTFVPGGNLKSMTKSVGKAIYLISDFFEDYKPDIVVVVADRYEIMAPAIVARYMNICLVHIQGGEITGTIDDTIRHTISKLANYHFVSNLSAKNNLINMGERDDHIFITGCPTIDIIKENDDKMLKFALEFWQEYGVQNIPKYIMVNFHPVTTEYLNNSNYIDILYKSIKKLDYKIVWLLPNSDAGSNKILKELEKIQTKQENIIFIKNLEPLKYLALVKYSNCIVGNSSVGIRESSFMGVPSVTIGTRQQNRDVSKNVVKCDMNSKQIEECIKYQLAHGKYKISYLYGPGNASVKISNLLLNIKLENEKYYGG